MNELKTLLDRQAKWQKSLRDLPWSEKVRMAAILRDSVAKLRHSAPASKAVTSRGASSRDRK